jgi:hypothetical protein
MFRGSAIKSGSLVCSLVETPKSKNRVGENFFKMVRIVKNTAIQTALEMLAASEKLNCERRKVYLKYQTQKSLPLEIVQKMSKDLQLLELEPPPVVVNKSGTSSVHEDTEWMPYIPPERKKNKYSVWLHELLQNCELEFPQQFTPIKRENPILEARLQQLQFEADNQRYTKMVANVSYLQEMERRRDIAEVRSLTSQINVGLNIIISIFTFFVAGFFITKIMTYNYLTATIVGTFFAIGAMMIETILFVIRGARIDQQMVMKDEQLRRGRMSPFSPETPQKVNISTSTPSSSPLIVAVQNEDSLYSTKSAKEKKND